MAMVDRIRDDDFLRGRRDQAMKHALRLKILGLARSRQSLDPADLSKELPERPAIAVIKYHVLVLEQVELLP